MYTTNGVHLLEMGNIPQLKTKNQKKCWLNKPSSSELILNSDTLTKPVQKIVNAGSRSRYARSKQHRLTKKNNNLGKLYKIVLYLNNISPTWISLKIAKKIPLFFTTIFEGPIMSQVTVMNTQQTMDTSTAPVSIRPFMLQLT